MYGQLHSLECLPVLCTWLWLQGETGFQGFINVIVLAHQQLAALKILRIACSCSNLLSFPIPISEIPNPDHTWLLKLPSTHEQPLQIGWCGRTVKTHLYFQTHPLQNFCKCTLEHLNSFLLMSVLWHQPCIQPLPLSGSVTAASFLQDQVSTVQTDTGLSLTSGHSPKGLKTCLSWLWWGRWSQAKLVAEPGTDLRSSKVFSRSCFFSTPAFFPPNLDLSSSFEGQ